MNDGGLCWWDFFTFTRGSGLTWPELTLFFTSKQEIGNSAFFERRLWWERTAQKGAPHLTTENHVVWRNFPLNRKISNGWLRAWWSSIRYPSSIAKSSNWKETFLIADLRKFYWVSNLIAESHIRREIFIIAEQRKFFEVFYCGIAMPWTQKLWMLNTRLAGVLPLRLFIKKLPKKQIAEICLNTSFS